MEVLKMERNLKIELINEKLIISETNHNLNKFYKNLPRVTRESIHFSTLEPLVSYSAVSHIPNSKGKLKSKPVKIFETKDIVRPGIFYGGQKTKEFIYPSITEGSLGELTYTKQLVDPHMIPPFYFSDLYDVKEARFTVTFPSDVKIQYNLFNTDQAEVQFNSSEKNGITTYTWEAKNLKRFIYNEKAPSRAYYEPHLVIRIASYNSNGIQYNISGSTDDLFTWYNSLIRQIPAFKDSQAMEDKVMELTKDCQSEKEKVKVLYKWVQSNIKYIAFENGMQGFIPHAAGDVFNKKYGDCKDMANLLTTMLKHAGIEAYITWVGTNSKPYKYTELPCTISDNHMICSIKSDNGFTYLDPTNSDLSPDRIPRLIQDKQTLIRLSDSTYTIETVPITAAEENKRTDLLLLNINDKELIGKAVVVLNGYRHEDFLADRLHAKMDRETNFIRDYVQLGQASAAYSTIQQASKDTSTVIAFDAQFSHEVIDLDEKLYVNLNIDPSVEEFKIDDINDRVHPIQQDYKHDYTLQCIFTIPEGYQVTYLPDAVTFENNLFGIQTSYLQKEKQIIYTKKILSDYLVMNPVQFKDYQKFFNEILKVKKQKITLTKLKNEDI
ncbi:transglutaminase-like domain-containing protein [Limibacter armeniacum]|uniref:transglutaminase-like domain-containing protein n=1 Tax=Limibacter armeniacum TaxID=466084 RepID=UPI002FE5C2F9